MPYSNIIIIKIMLEYIYTHTNSIIINTYNNQISDKT